MNLVQCIIPCYFTYNRKFHVVLCPSSHQILATPLTTEHRLLAKNMKSQICWYSQFVGQFLQQQCRFVLISGHVLGQLMHIFGHVLQEPPQIPSSTRTRSCRQTDNTPSRPRHYRRTTILLQIGQGVRTP